MSPSHNHDGMLLGQILCGSSAGNHSCSDFMSATAVPCPEDIGLQHRFSSSSFHILIFDVPCFVMFP